MDTPSENFELLKHLKNNYRTFMLSNTNAIHVQRYGKSWKDKFGLEDGLSNLFEQVYYSHKVGLKKPDHKIFCYILKENKLKPEETLFIDDSVQNIITANNLGLKTINLTERISLLKLFKEDKLLNELKQSKPRP